MIVVEDMLSVVVVLGLVLYAVAHGIGVVLDVAGVAEVVFGHSVVAVEGYVIVVVAIAEI